MKTKLSIIFFLFQMSAASAQESGDTSISSLSKKVESVSQSLDLKNQLKFSGYIQSQFQFADSAGQQGYSGGDFGAGVDKRFQLRRARIKFQYDGIVNDKGWSTSQFVLQIDVRETGLSIRDVYLKFTDPWTGWFSLTTGMQKRPFGFEVGYSSSNRESPERGRMSQIIFPNERDLGAMLTIQGPKNSNWNWLKFEGGIFNGTGAPSAGANTSDFDKYKDFIGHITASKATASEKIKWGLGASIYNGGFRQDVSDRYEYAVDDQGISGYDIAFSKGDINPGISARKNVKRNYVGVDGQLNIDWNLGLTSIRAEYIQGKQPSVSGSSNSPSSAPTQTNTTTTTVVTGIDSSGNPVTTNLTSTSTGPSDIYVRNFNGAYIYFVQTLGQLPFQAIVKYDWYDPNTDVKGDEIGKRAFNSSKQTTNRTDLRFDTWGFGLAYRWDTNVKLTAYYDMVRNETSANLSGYTKDIKDDLVTLRVQVKF